jgi:hypothetical protein
MKFYNFKIGIWTALASVGFILIQLGGCSNGGSISLFDGSTLNGWEGKPEMFRVEDGVIVAGTLSKAIPNNEFLCSQGIYEDFELRLKAKLLGEKGNAGIQFRSKRVPESHEVSGYQCDMGETQEVIWGYLYDESRRDRFLAQPENAEMLKVLKPDDWNEFVIRAQGSRIQIWLNGFKTIDYQEEEPGIAQSGVVCLQIHSGKPSEARFKDIELMQLD